MLEKTDMHLATSYVRRFELSLLFPDALHIAICARISTALVTGDKQQARAAEMLGIPVVKV